MAGVPPFTYWVATSGEQMTKVLDLSRGLRTCRVTCRDLDGIEHTVDVTADSHYEAVAHSLRAFRDTDWAGDIGHGQTTVTVVVKRLRLSTRFASAISRAGSNLPTLSRRNESEDPPAPASAEMDCSANLLPARSMPILRLIALTCTDRTVIPTIGVRGAACAFTAS